MYNINILESCDKERDKELDNSITEYIDSLNEIERLAFDIAKRELKSSFIIEKTIGYLEFMKSRQDDK